MAQSQRERPQNQRDQARSFVQEEERKKARSIYIFTAKEGTYAVRRNGQYVLVEVPGHLEDALVEGLEVLEEAGREVWCRVRTKEGGYAQ